MRMRELNRAPGAGRGSIPSGLLLGFLLLAFLVALIYVAYLFLAWGRSAAAQAPEMPPLALPRLVRLAPGEAGAEGESSSSLFRPISSQPEEAALAAVGRTTLLLLGVDARPGQKVARTDSIILLTFSPEAGSAGMLSIPRDLRVRPSVLDRDVKVNTVYPYGEATGFPGGGSALLRDTVTELVGYPIDYYVLINFEGFQQIVDLIGGIDLDVPSEIYDDKYPDNNYGYEPPVHFLPGLQHMDGATALKYARTRHADNDYMRAARQQQVIMAIKDKVTQPGQLAALLPRLPSLALATANSVQTDMPVDQVIALARALDRIDLQSVTRVVIDSKMGTVTPNDPELGYVLTPDLGKVRAAAAAVFADLPEAPAPEETAQQVIQAEAARIVVLNGTQEKGVATKVQVALTANGFNVLTVGNADRGDYAESWIIAHGDAAPVTLEALIRRFNIPPDRLRSEPPAEDADITVIIGRDHLAADAP